MTGPELLRKIINERTIVTFTQNEIDDILDELYELGYRLEAANWL